MKTWLDKLRMVAQVVAREKPKLHFFGLVPHALLPDRWDLLISSDQLDRSGMESLRYIIKQLKKRLTTREFLKIGQMVIMPRDKALLKKLNQPGEFSVERLHGLYRFNLPDEVVVIWPTRKTTPLVQTV
jgi:hypothetical protein